VRKGVYSDSRQVEAWYSMYDGGEYRIERDTLGEMRVPKDAYYGAQTARAVENFPISGWRFPRAFIRAMALIKYAAAKANQRLGYLDAGRAEAIQRAALEVAEGRFDDQFVVDVFQTGSGTSTNMNTNEVIAYRAAELMGGRRGDKTLIHPNDHVNFGQSTNDVFPTAIHVAAAELIAKELTPNLEALEESLRRKAEEFRDVVKAGRTHLQDAMPITLGQEFSGYAAAVKHGIERVKKALEELLELPIGGTAVGTGINTHPDFAKLVVEELRRQTGLEFRVAENRFEAMQLKDACVSTSGALKTVAGSILKIANDLRLLSSGPNTGLAEVELPATQPGSSIMPGKVNPVIPESTLLACVKVIANDVSITMANQLGELELNMGMPLIAYDLLSSIIILANTARNLAVKCVDGIVANAERCRGYAESSPALITVVAPVVGYDKAAAIAKRVLAERRTVREVLLEEGVAADKINEILDLLKMTRGGVLAKP